MSATKERSMVWLRKIAAIRVMVLAIAAVLLCAAGVYGACASSSAPGR